MTKIFSNFFNRWFLEKRNILARKNYDLPVEANLSSPFSDCVLIWSTRVRFFITMHDVTITMIQTNKLRAGDPKMIIISHFSGKPLEVQGLGVELFIEVLFISSIWKLTSCVGIELLLKKYCPKSLAETCNVGWNEFWILCFKNVFTL